MEGSLPHKYAYVHLPTTTGGIKHPIVYPLLPLSTDYDKKTVVLNAYFKLPPPDGGSDVQRGVCILLFNGQTGETLPMMYRSFIKLKVCNIAHVHKYKLEPQCCKNNNNIMGVGDICWEL